ncbi:hypothetical protein DL96DRAFT_860669 [Flagelloscypha sp. PMI_526]|nr:hypothetical protein DL96DRAFT_860669 [Flagelloscypha sp. PMI_526]
MSLGPSLVRLAARNLNLFNDFSTHITDFTRDIDSVSAPIEDSSKPSGSSETLESLGEMTGLSNNDPLNDTDSGLSLTGDSNDQEGNAIGLIQKIGELSVAAPASSAMFDPGRFYRGFRRSAGQIDDFQQLDKRVLDLSTSKTFLKMRGAWKGVAMRDLD